MIETTMAIRTYTIWIDGRAYGGEDPDVIEEAPALSGGRYDIGPTTVNGIRVGGEPYRIEGRLNLKSHLSESRSGEKMEKEAEPAT